MGKQEENHVLSHWVCWLTPHFISLRVLTCGRTHCSSFSVSWGASCAALELVDQNGVSQSVFLETLVEQNGISQNVIRESLVDQNGVSQSMFHETLVR